MNTIVEIVKNILFIIILTGFLELLLPEGGMKPFVRYAIGLFVIVAILNPILAALFDNHHFEISWWDTPAVVQGQDQIAQAGEKLQDQIGAVSSSDLQKKLEGQVSAVVNLVPGVKEVETQAQTDMKGNIIGLKLRIFPESFKSEGNAAKTNLADVDQKLQQQAAQVIQSKVKDLLINLYSIPEANIDITVEGG